MSELQPEDNYEYESEDDVTTEPEVEETEERTIPISSQSSLFFCLVLLCIFVLFVYER